MNSHHFSQKQIRLSLQSKRSFQEQTGLKKRISASSMTIQNGKKALIFAYLAPPAQPFAQHAIASASMMKSLPKTCIKERGRGHGAHANCRNSLRLLGA